MLTSSLPSAQAGVPNYQGQAGKDTSRLGLILARGTQHNDNLKELATVLINIHVALTGNNGLPPQGAQQPPATTAPTPVLGLLDEIEQSTALALNTGPELVGLARRIESLVSR